MPGFMPGIHAFMLRVEGVDGRKKSHHDEEAASDIMIYNINKASNFIFIS